MCWLTVYEAADKRDGTSEEDAGVSSTFDSPEPSSSTATLPYPNPRSLTYIMAKRKSNQPAAEEIAESDSDSDGSSSSSTPSLIDVEFDFFPPSLDVDLIALKRLLRSLLHSDSDLFNLHEIAECVLERCEQDGVGSCIKVDGEESDPFSFLTVLNLNQHKVRLRARPTREQPVKLTCNTWSVGLLRMLLRSRC